jgi:hypothetical protein
VLEELEVDEEIIDTGTKNLETKHEGFSIFEP